MRSMLMTAMLAAALLWLSLATPAFAADGVLEINQTCAVNTGCFAGDTAGFPVTITTSGSYRLTGRLQVPVDTDGIQANADQVSIDLNGFEVLGGGGAILHDGISSTNHVDLEVRNGTIRGFSRHGVFTNTGFTSARLIGVRAIANAFAGIELQSSGNLVDGCAAINNGTIGIRTFGGSLIINSVARGNTSFGFSVGQTDGYRSNVLTGNNGGDANAQVNGSGFQLGTNICGSDTVCP